MKFRLINDTTWLSDCGRYKIFKEPQVIPKGAIVPVYSGAQYNMYDIMDDYYADWMGFVTQISDVFTICERYEKKRLEDISRRILEKI